MMETTTEPMVCRACPDRTARPEAHCEGCGQHIRPTERDTTFRFSGVMSLVECDEHPTGYHQPATTLDREVRRFDRDVEEIRERPRQAATTERTAVRLTLADRLVRGSYFVDVRTLTLNGSGENQKVIVQGYRHGGPGSVNEPASIDLRPDEAVRVVVR